MSRVCVSEHTARRAVRGEPCAEPCVEPCAESRVCVKP